MGEGASQSRLWTRDYLLGLAVKLFTSLVFSTLSATLAAHALFVLCSTSAEAGFLVGVFVLASLLSRIVAGRYADMVGCRRTLVWSAALFFLLMMLYFLPLGVAGFMVLRFVHGLSFGIINNTSTLVVTRCIPEGRFGEGMAYFSLCLTLSAAVGPGIGVLLVGMGLYEAVFVVCAVYALAALVACVLMRVPEIELTAEDRHEMLHSFHVNDFIEVKAIPIGVVVLVWNACNSSVTSFVNTYSLELGLASWVSWYFVVCSVAMFVTRPATGKLYDRKGPNVAVYPFAVLMVAGLVLLALCPLAGGVALLAAAALMGMGHGTAHSTCQTICVQAASPRRAGVATATFYAFADMGLSLGPTIMGCLHPVVGYSGMYSSAAVVTLAGLVFYHIAIGRKLKGRKVR